jgi:group I intron endonuclease
MLIYHFDLSYNPKSEVIGLARRLFKRGFNGGVYFWLNTLNGKMYIGSSLNLSKRLANYWETTPKGTSIIRSALLKYSHESFVLIVVFLNSVNRDQVLALEQNALDTFKPAYNASPLASSPLGFKHSDEAKEKNRQNTLARGWKGKTHPSYNTGKPVFLLSVL